MGQLLASAGEIDLNPPPSGWMTGFAARISPTTGTHDPLMARAVLLDDGAQRAAIVACDLLGWAPADAREMRRRIGQAAALSPDGVLLSCTHTHSGPACMPLRGVMGYVDETWLAATQAQIIDLLGSLAARLVPASLSWAATAVSGIGYNRQDPAHPTDESVVAMGIDALEPVGEGRPRAIATLVNYATHAVVMGPQNLLYSGDFPGAVARHLAARRGGIGLYLQGACGDVDPVVYRDRGWGTGAFSDTEAIGERLAAAADGALKEASSATQVTLGAGRRTVQVPVDPPPTEEDLGAVVADLRQQEGRARAAADVIQEQVALAMLEWAARLREGVATGRWGSTLSFEIAALRLNDLRLVGIPFETYTDIGLGIKRHLAPLQGVLMGYTNGLYGYFPTRWAKEQGGYGADTSCRWFPTLLTPIGRGADDILVAEAAALACLL